MVLSHVTTPGDADYVTLMVLMSRDALRARCRAGGLSVAGTKKELAYRILAAPDDSDAKVKLGRDYQIGGLFKIRDLPKERRDKLIRESPPVRCCVFGCQNAEPDRRDDNVGCWRCKHLTCSVCTEQIFTDSWTAARFDKPKIEGCVHEVFTCPMCRASFDRIRH